MSLRSLTFPFSSVLTLLPSSVCQIVKEPPPLWEVPPNCNNFTAKVFKAGLRKDPERRASAKELRRKTTKALRAGQRGSENVKKQNPCDGFKRSSTDVLPDLVLALVWVLALA